jgi:hypothetical protein
MNVASSSPHSRSNVLVWAGLLLLLYVLSIGPAVKFARDNRLPKDTVETVYAPLVWLCDTPAGEKFVRPSLIWYGETIWRWEMPIK